MNFPTRLLLASSSVLILIIVGCEDAKATRVSQRQIQEFTIDPNLKSLVSEVKAVRNNDGGIVITANAFLPSGTKVMVDFGPAGTPKLFGQDKPMVSNGVITTAPFTNKGKPWLKGNYRVSLFCRFDSVWQTAEIRGQTGEYGSKLPKAALKPVDPDLPTSNQNRWEMNCSFPITLSDLNEDQKIIERVKNSKLTVQGLGHSSESIIWIVKSFAKAPGFTPKDWSALKQQDGSWVVTLACIDGGSPEKAEWSYNPKSGEVKFLNHTAKNLSWAPNY